MSILIENLRRDMRMRVESDRIMSTNWLFIYLIPVFSLLLSAFSMASLRPSWPRPTVPFTISLMALTLNSILFVGSLIVTLVLIYMLVNRRNMHFRRQLLLFEDIVSVVKEIASRRGIDVSLQLGLCERTIREVKIEETEKNAVLWAILSAITGIATLYVCYFLMKDFYRHERREDMFWEDLGKALTACGVPFAPRREYPIPDRSFILYLMLTIITLGVFGIYWLYVLIKDPNQHFRQQAIFEDYLLRQFETAIMGF